MSVLPEGYSIRKLEIEDIKDVLLIYETITGEDGPVAAELEARMDYGDSYWQRNAQVSKLYFANKDGLFELQKAETVPDVCKIN